MNKRPSLCHWAALLVSAWWVCILGVTYNAVAQEREPAWAYEKWHQPIQDKASHSTSTPLGLKGEQLLHRLTVSGYGTMNYHNYLQYDLDPYTRDKIDLEKFALYVHYRLTPKIRLFTEVEYEHGGTGATMEFDALEEAGEFEMEIEQGGEVKLEALFLDFAFHPAFNLRVGRTKLGIGLCNNLDRPNKYFTTTRIEGESTMLPNGWYETGLQAYGWLWNNRLSYQLSLTSGLDSSGFSGRNWIQGGYQTRFEMPQAEAFAISGRLNYNFGKQRKSFVGLSAYANNTNPNRPKNDLANTKGWVTIVGGHLALRGSNWVLNASILWGNLQNSDIISQKNASLSNSLNVKRRPIGKEVLTASVEVGYNLLPILGYHGKQALFPFARYDYYDTMHKTSGNVIKDGKWERHTWATGLNWMPNQYIVLKAHYTDRTFNQQHIDRVTHQDMGHLKKEREVTIGVGFSF